MQTRYDNATELNVTIIFDKKHKPDHAFEYFMFGSI